MNILHVILIVAILLIVFGGGSHLGHWGGPSGYGLWGGGLGLVLLVIILILLFR